MTDTSYDQSGAARQALLEIYRDYGTAGLDNDVVVNQLLPDLLPNSPREASVVRAAASVGVAGLLNARFAANLPVDSAVRDVASLMMQRHALDQFACLWIVTEYSTVLGHPLAVPSVLSSVPQQPVSSAPPAPTPPASATQMDTGYGAPSGYGQPAYPAPAAATPYAPPTTPYAPPYGQTSTPPYGQTSNPPFTQASTPPYVPGQAAPGQPSQPSQPSQPNYAPTTAFPAQSPGGFTPATPGGFTPAAAPGGFSPASYPQYGPPSYNTTPPKSKAPLIIILVVVGLLLVGGGIIAVVLSGKKGTPTVTPSNSVKVSAPPSGNTSPSVDPSTPPPGPVVEALEALLPKDIDASLDCDEDPTSDLPDNGVGIVKNFSCTESSQSTLPDALVFAYQMKDSASFDATWDALNKQLIFDPKDSKLADRCPSSSSAGGLTTWHKGDGPTLGELECWGADSGGYVYMWGWKDNQAIFIIHGKAAQSRDAVDKWWQNES
jgi:hypothetical protein